MKLDYDCVRAVLLHLEETLERGDNIQGRECAEAFEAKFIEEDVYYAIEKLHEAKYITVQGDGCKQPTSITVGKKTTKLPPPPKFINGERVRIIGITFPGHQYLDAVRDDAIHSKAKEMAKGIGLWSLDLIKRFATEVIMLKLAGGL